MSISMAQDLNVAGSGFKLSQRLEGGLKTEEKMFTDEVLDQIKAQ